MFIIKRDHFHSDNPRTLSQYASIQSIALGLKFKLNNQTLLSQPASILLEKLYRKKKDDIFAEEKTSSHLSELEKLYTKLKIVQGKLVPV